MDFATTIIAWYKKNARDLPWRNTRDPYKIWLSEIILQQTRVDQGMEYYHRFVNRFRTICDLASASENEILKMWQGLGYYSRARNLHGTAKQICDLHHGNFPESYNALLRLKGIGPYSAAAISSFAFDEAKAVVDGNVYRVLSRFFGMHNDISSTQVQAKFRELAQEILPPKKAAIYNQAIMEFGAMQCVPKNPDCSKCPISQACMAYSQQLVHQLPVKIKKTKAKSRHIVYFVFRKGNFYFIQQRDDSSIWKNMFDFPGIENEQAIADKDIFRHLKKEFHLSEVVLKHRHEAPIHLLSHLRISAVFLEIHLPDNFVVPDTWMRVKWKMQPETAIPRLIHKYLESRFNTD
jgi:A/G-specific adenine glycosylase